MRDQVRAGGAVREVEVTLADFRIWAGNWVCRHCRRRARTMSQIEHMPDCAILQRPEVKP